MLNSGGRFEWPKGHPPIVDKHSTGGIGDKTSLILAPLLAADGCWVPMISGRGLGITGGTLDKLESIPGFDVRLPKERILAQVREIGVAMVGQTTEICPADRKLYALRDVTGTVPSRPLIVASIMSKKLAEGLDRLVLDVKFGSGAFMKTRPEAAALAQAMIDVGTGIGVATSALLTQMDEPLGRTIGNALEVQECLDVLQGKGPRDLVELTLDLAAPLTGSSREQLAEHLADGRAWSKFQALVQAQGGDLDRFGARKCAPVIHEVLATQSGTVSRMEAGILGRAACDLGAGRACAEEEIDHAVGFDQLAKCGAAMREGDVLLRIHARDVRSAETAARAVESAVHIRG